MAINLNPKPVYLDLTNPICKAVMPLKVEAVERAAKEARATVAAVMADMEANGWDLQKAAPRARSFGVSRYEYRAASTKHSLYSSLTVSVEGSRHIDAPDIRKRDAKSVTKYVDAAKADAAYQYDAFVWKLCNKCGPVTAAVLKGSHVWGYSFLTVTKADSTTEVWKTQMIVNRSVLGTLFNQFPTRKVKVPK